MDTQLCGGHSKTEFGASPGERDGRSGATAQLSRPRSPQTKPLQLTAPQRLIAKTQGRSRDEVAHAGEPGYGRETSLAIETEPETPSTHREPPRGHGADERPQDLLTGPEASDPRATNGETVRSHPLESQMKI